MASTDKLIRIILQLKDEMSGQLDKAGSKLSKIGSQMTSVGKNMTMGITAPIVGAGAAMFKTFADFEDVMAEMGARTGATADEMEKMQQVAIEMGRDTVFSATESAEAMLELTASGSSAAEAMQQIPDVLNLAAAGALDLGVAADGVTDIMKQFQLTVDDTAMITDELARAAGSSSATVNDLLQAFANAGPVASQFGLDVNETAAALGILAENGVKGAEAGTQMKSMLLNMSRLNINAVAGAWKELGVSMFDTAGNVRPIDDIFKDLNAAMEGMPMKRQIYYSKTLAGNYGLIGFNALRASNGLSDMQQQMLDAASAQEVADARMSTLAGSFKSMMGSIETLGIVLGGLSDGPLVAVIKGITGIINAITSFAQAHPLIAQIVMIFLALLAAVGPVLMIIGGIASGISAIGAAFTAIGGVVGILTVVAQAFMALGAAVVFIASPLGLIVTGIALVIASLVALRLAWEKNFLGIADIFKNIGNAWSTLTNGIREDIQVWKNNFQMLGEIIRLGVERFKEWMSGIGEFLAGVNWGNLMISAGKAIIMGIINGIKSMVTQLWETVKSMASGIADTVRNAFKIRSPSKVMMKLGEQVGEGFNQGVQAMGGFGVSIPTASGTGSASTTPMMAGAGLAGGNVYINTISVPPGTTQEQAEAIMREIGKAAKRRGAKGLR